METCKCSQIEDKIPRIMIAPRQFNEEEVQDYLERLRKQKEDGKVLSCDALTPDMIYAVILEYYKIIYKETIIDKQDRILFMINDKWDGWLNYSMLEVMTNLKDSLENGKITIEIKRAEGVK